MSLFVIRALIQRHLFLYARNRIRLIELLFWPVMEMLVWGNLSIWLSRMGETGDLPLFLPWLMGAVILWDVLFRAQQGVAITFLEDVWTRNLLNLFAAPIRPVEYLFSAFAVGVLRIAITVGVLSVLAAIAFHFNLLVFRWYLVPFFGLLMFFGWTLGILSTALILRWGQAAESLAWAVPFMIQPVAAVYYPVHVLPGWAQSISWCLPCTPVFEGMRSVVQSGSFDSGLFFHSLALNAVWMAGAAAVYFAVLRSGRRNGTLTRVASH